MTLNKETFGEVELETIVQAMPRIYSTHDPKRSIWDVWLHATHHAAAIGEEVRKASPEGNLLKEIADFEMWLFTAIEKMIGDFGTPKSGEGEFDRETLIRVGNDYSSLLWNKYPQICPVCFWRRSNDEGIDENDERFSRPCDCLLHEVETRKQSDKRKRVESLREFAAQNLGKKPSSIDEWQEMFGRIFSTNLRHLNLPDIAFHLLEEVGEVSDAMVRMYTYTREDFIRGEPVWRQIWLEEELADVTSWVFALVEKVDLIRRHADSYDKWRFGDSFVQREPIRLSQIIWNRYGSNDLSDFYCGICTDKVCTCPIILVPPDKSIEKVIELYSTTSDAHT